MIKVFLSIVLLSVTSVTLAADDVIRIGVIGPFSGKSSTDMGQSILGGARVFVAEANKLDLLGKRIELVEKDDQAIPDVGVRMAEELVKKDKVVAVVGFANFGVATKAAKVFQAAKIPLIVSAATGGEITVLDLPPKTPNYIFRLAARDALQTRTIFRELVERKKITDIAILHDDTPYGTSGKTNALTEMKRLDINPLHVDSFQVGDQDMTRQLTKARDAGAKAIVIYGLASEGAAVAKSAAKIGLKLPLVGSWTLSQRSFLELAGKAGDGTRMAVTLVEDSSNPQRSAFIKAYLRENQVDNIPSLVAAAQTYDALRLVYVAMFQAGSTNSEAIKNALENLSFRVESTVVTRYDKPFSTSDHEAITENMVMMGEVLNKRVGYAYRQDAAASMIMRKKSE